MSRDLSSRIFVGGLDHGVNEADLEKAFKIFGTITNVVVLRDKETGHSRGFAFVSYIDSQSSEDAIRRMHGVEIKGRCVTVRHAEKAKYFDDRPRRGGLRGGGRGGFSDRGRSDTHSTGASYGSNGFTGNRRGRGGFRSETGPSYGAGRDTGYSRQESSTYGARSRSPIGATSTYRAADSPPRRRVPDRGYSPPSRRDDYSPPAPLGRLTGSDYYQGAPSRMTDYYGTGRDTSPTGPRAQLGRSPPPEDYGQYGSMQTLSPARERDAYINARAQDYSPLRRQAYPSPESGSTRNQGSELGRSTSRQDRLRDYGGATSGQYGSGSYSAPQDSGYGSRAGSNQQGLGASRYGNISNNHYGSSLTRGRKETSPVGGRGMGGQTGRFAARTARDDSPPRRRAPSPRDRQRRSPIGRRDDSPPKRRGMSPPRRQTMGLDRGRAPSPGGRRAASPIARHSGQLGGRGPSPIGRRGSSPLGRIRGSPVRKRGPSPMRKSDVSPLNRRGSSPVGRRGPPPMSRSGPSPMDRRGPSPVNRRGPSPMHKRGPSPMGRRGLSPPRKRGPSPMRKRGPSPMRRPGMNHMNKNMPSPMSRRMPAPMGRRPSSPVGRQGPDRRY